MINILGECFDEFFGMNEYDPYDPFEGGDACRANEDADDDPTQGDEIRTPWGGLVD